MTGQKNSPSNSNNTLYNFDRRSIITLLVMMMIIGGMIGLVGLSNIANATPFDDFFADHKLVGEKAPMIDAYDSLVDRSENAFDELDDLMKGRTKAKKAKVVKQSLKAESHQHHNRPSERIKSSKPKSIKKRTTQQRVKTVKERQPRQKRGHLKKGQGSSSKFEVRVLELVNKERARGGRCGTESFRPSHPLSPQKQLAQAAKVHGQAMATQHFFSHHGLAGETPRDRITETGYQGQAWGENIAAGQKTPNEVVTEWMDSPGHCRNILNSLFTELGVSFVFDPKSPYKTYWVQAFGRSR